MTVRSNSMEVTVVLVDLPLAILMHIFTLLPAKYLLIVRSVCKFFLHTIDDDEFILFYRRNNPGNLQENRILTLRSHCHEFTNTVHPHLCECLNHESRYQTRCEVLEHESDASTSKLNWIEPSSFFDNSFSHRGIRNRWFIAGSLDGLILIVGSTFIMLWNPSIRKTRQIPSPITKPVTLTDMRVGFGYDESCKDYKILAIWDPYHPFMRMEEGESKVWVYSVKSGSWATVPLPPCHHKREMSESVAFKNGLVWIEGVDTGHSYYHHLVWLDFAMEKYRYFALPYPIKDNLWIANRFVMIDGGGSLGVLGLDNDRRASLWIMDDNATELSWTKVYNFGEGVQQMRAFRNREIVWEYWTKTARMKPSVYIDGYNGYDSNGYFEYVDAYIESLVLHK